MITNDQMYLIVIDLIKEGRSGQNFWNIDFGLWVGGDGQDHMYQHLEGGLGPFAQSNKKTNYYQNFSKYLVKNPSSSV